MQDFVNRVAGLHLVACHNGEALIRQIIPKRSEFLKQAVNSVSNVMHLQLNVGRQSFSILLFQLSPSRSLPRLSFSIYPSRDGRDPHDSGWRDRPSEPTLPQMHSPLAKTYIYCIFIYREMRDRSMAVWQSRRIEMTSNQTTTTVLAWNRGTRPISNKNKCVNKCVDIGKEHGRSRCSNKSTQDLMSQATPPSPVPPLW